MVRLGRYRLGRTMLVGAAGVVAVLVAGFAVVLAGSVGGAGGSVASIEPGRAERALGRAADAAAAADSAAGPAVAEPGGIPGQGVPLGGVQPALVRTAQLTVEVDDPAAASRQVRTAAAGAGAVVAEEQSGVDGAWLVLRVPADSLDRFVEDVAAFGHVTGRNSQVVDATEEVIDLDARVASQQASVARVRALLAQAESISDVVAVESELSRREADLDSLTSRLAALRDQVAMSTLTVDLRAVPGAAGNDERAVGFLDGFSAGWDGLRVVGSGAAAVVGFLLPFVPVLAVLGGIGWLARRVLRARRLPAVAGGRSGPGTEGES